MRRTRTSLRKRRHRSPSDKHPKIKQARWDAYLYQGRKCYWCCRKLSTNKKRGGFLKWSADHLTPLSEGGLNSPDNIVASCRKCNSERASWKPIIIYYVRW